jgi:hypothetical protein
MGIGRFLNDGRAIMIGSLPLGCLLSLAEVGIGEKRLRDIDATGMRCMGPGIAEPKISARPF